MESNVKHICLLDASSDIVASYLEWLYSGNIASIGHSSSKPEFDVVEEYVHLAHMYVFGEKIEDDAFCDQV